MDGESAHQPVQRRRLRLDIEVRRSESGTMQPGDQAPADLPNGLIALIQNLSGPSISRCLSDKRDGDLHLQASFRIARKEFLDDGENDRARFVSETSAWWPLVLHEGGVVLARGYPALRV